MAFLKKAYAAVVHPGWGLDNWGNFIGQNRGQLAEGPYRTASASPNLVAQASEILQDDFSPEKYLLTHSTIVASVDTVDVPNVKLGTVNELGRSINRQWSDYHITPETEGWINNNCFVPGTLVTMADGTVKPIEQIQKGDEVLSHLGRSRRVRDVMCREVDEPLYEINPRATTERIYATGEHPFFVFRENNCPNCGIPARSKSSYNSRCATHLIGKFYCSKECWYEKKIQKTVLLAEKQGEFVEAQNLSDRDFVTTPVLRDTVSVDLSPAQARLIGLFVAEGYYELDSDKENERVGVMWAFHEEEAPTLAKTVCELMNHEFGVECVVREHSNDKGIHVTTRTNRDMVAFFSKWVRGETSGTKTLHSDLIRASHDLQMEIVRGWVEGDGCFQDTMTGQVPGDIRITGSTASRSLANQIQIICNRLGVANRLTRTETSGRSRLLIDGEARVVNDPSKPKNVSWAIGCGGASVEDLAQTTVYEEQYAHAVEKRGGLQAAAKFRFFNGYELQIIQSIQKIDYTGPVYNFDVDEDHSYIANGVAVHNCDAWSRPVLLKSYRTFIGAQNFCEHVQVEEMSKGRILDAVARDIGPSVYIDILTATDRKHTALIQDIEAGRMSTLSMGCSVSITACTKCGNAAVDETEMCACVKYEKGNMFFDAAGNRRKVAELCGHESIDPTGGVTFIEASWVAIPAFQGAVMRNILGPKQVNVDTRSQMQQVLASPPREWTDDGMPKAAHARGMEIVFDDTLGTAADLKRLRLGQDGMGAPPPPGDDMGAPGGVPMDPGGGMPGMPGAEEGAEKDPMEEMEDALEKYVLDKVQKRLEKKMQEEVSEDAVSDPELATSSNENINHQASLVAGARAVLRTARSDVALLDGLAKLNDSHGVKISRDIYRTALRVGSTDGHPSLEGYLRHCAGLLDRKPTLGEAKTLVRLGRILSLRKKTRS